jgi:hypothetical protein
MIGLFLRHVVLQVKQGARSGGHYPLRFNAQVSGPQIMAGASKDGQGLPGQGGSAGFKANHSLPFCGHAHIINFIFGGFSQ